MHAGRTSQGRERSERRSDRIKFPQKTNDRLTTCEWKSAKAVFHSIHQIYCKNSDGTRQNTCFWPLGLNTTTTNTNTLRIYSYASSGTGCIQIDLDVLELPADYVAGFYNNDGLSSQLTADFSSFSVGDTLLIIGYLGYLDGSTFRTTRMEGVVMIALYLLYMVALVMGWQISLGF